MRSTAADLYGRHTDSGKFAMECIARGATMVTAGWLLFSRWLDDAPTDRRAWARAAVGGADPKCFIDAEREAARGMLPRHRDGEDCCPGGTHV